MPVFPPIINNNISNIRDTLHITLTAAGWANNQQVIPCNSVGSNSTVMPNPTAASKDAYINAGIELTEATAESLTFTCSTVPTEDIAVLVHIIDHLITAESTKILTFDSVDEMNAYEAEEGAIAIVPSEGGELVKVVELTSTIPRAYDKAENNLLEEAWQSGAPVVIKTPISSDYAEALLGITHIAMPVSRCNVGFVCGISTVLVVFMRSGDGVWSCMIQA